MSFRINIEVTYQNNTWKGFIAQNGITMTLESCKAAVESLTNSCNSLEYISVEHTNGSETVFNKNILENSVINYKIEEYA